MNVSIGGQTSDLISTGDQILWTIFLATCIRLSPCIKRSLSHFSGWLLNTGSTVDFYMSIKSCAIDCILYFFPCNLAHTGIQFNAVYTRALKSSRSLPSFSIRDHTLFGQSCYFTVFTNLFSFYQLTELHNVTTEWLNNTVETTLC